MNDLAKGEKELKMDDHRCVTQVSWFVWLVCADHAVVFTFFDMLQYFETILPSVESLWCSQQGKVYLMGGDPACRPVTSPTIVAILAGILDFTKN